MMELQYYKENFDVREYLDEQGIDYVMGGKNVGQGWVELNCFFCGTDPSYHLGVNAGGGNYFSCWVCGEKGDVIVFIQRLEDCSFPVAVEILKRHQKGVVARPDVVRGDHLERGGVTARAVLPAKFEYIKVGREPEPVRRYFEQAGLDLSLCQKYRVGYVWSGEYQHRMVVPIYLDGRVVSWQAIDVTGKARIPKLNCPKDRAIIQTGHLLYGVDGLGSDQVILVEGVKDKWKLGDDALALFTKQWTVQQLNLLFRRARDKRLKVLLDLDAVRDGEGLARELLDRWDQVQFVELEEGDGFKDPGEFPQEFVDRVIKG